jgi:hypothetical protein
MSLLFDEESGSDTEAGVPASNGLDIEPPISPGIDAATSPSSSVNAVTLSDDELPPRYGGVTPEEEEEEEEAEAKGPRDDIGVTVTGYQKSGEDYTFDVEVHGGRGWLGSKVSLLRAALSL